ncbi:NHL repeat-containing protein [Saccharicrinis aurantiacus]|uniref:hypothetical protein n=1 Tax=Saccharicrinis aurantiacus TaxID=1849719 RepID=UPI0009500202|nr:hypothetical protein [Saccharicrinis aurantiacus]
MNKLRLLLLALPFLFASCSNDDDNKPSLKITGHYVLNYGSYSATVGSLSYIDLENNTVQNGAYESANGVSMSGKPQYAYEYKGNIYFMGNAKDEIFHVSADDLTQTQNGVAEDIIKPRFCVGNGDYLYISCWGGDIWAPENREKSYIAKYNINTNTVEKKIMLPDGPEGLAIVDNTLYCTLNYTNKIAMVNLNTEKITYIEDLPAVSTYFIKDNSNNLYVSLVSSYTDGVIELIKEPGLGYINTSTNELEANYKFEGISGLYSSVLAFNTDKSKLYVVGGSYGANGYSGGIYSFNTNSKTFDETPFVDNISGINGVYYNITSNLIYVMISQSTTTNGLLKTYDTEGNIIEEYATGISPGWIVDVTK